MKTPPDQQISAILYFLHEALRSDAEIQKWTSGRPEEIVAQVCEYQPLQRADERTYLYVSQLPALCLHIVSATPKFFGPRKGREFTANLWYLFRTPQSDTAEIHGLAKAERIKSLIWWRINHWLRYQTVPITADANLDLQELSMIRRMTVGSTTWFSEGDIEGLKMDLTVEHAWAPYDEHTPATLDLIDMTITADAGSGPIVEADIDTT